MNSNFKVVFNKARGALMVANEITSSVQAKGTKTVVAAAVAAVMAGVAGSAMAATQPEPVTNIQLVTGSSVELVQKDASGSQTTVTGVLVDTGATDDKKNLAWDADKYQIPADASNVTIQATGGSLVVDATGYTGSTDFAKTYGAVTGTVAGMKVVANDKVNSTLTLKSVDLDSAVIELGTHNGKGASAKKNATLTADSVTLKEGSLTTTATSATDADASGRGVASLVASSGAMTLGYDATYVAGTDNKVVEADAKSFDITAGADTLVQSSGALIYNAGTVKNAASLTFESTSGAVTLDNAVVFAGNTGKISVKASGAANFDANYDSTVDGFTGGQLVVQGETVSVAGSVKAASVLVGTPAADDKTAVVLNGSTNTTLTGSLTATDTLTLGSALTVTAGTVDAAATKVSGATAAIAVADSGQKLASVNLGALTVDAAATANKLTITNNASGAVSATTLKIVGASGANSGVGTVELTAGKLSLESMDIAASGTLTIGNGAEASVTLTKGESVNAGTVEMGASGTLTVAKDVVLTNAAGGKIGADTPDGTLVVAGTVKNIASTDSNNRTTYGVLQSETLKVTEGGLVETKLGADSYKVTTTEVAGGTFKTELNARVDGVTPNTTDKLADALDLNTAFTLNEGSIVYGADNTEVTNFVLTGTSGALTLQSDKALNSVKVVSGGQFYVENEAVVSVKDLNLVSGAATFDSADVTVDQLRTTAAETVNLKDSTLNASVAALGLKVSGSIFEASKYDADARPTNGNVLDGSIKLDQDSTLKITGIAEGTEFTVAGLSGAKALVSGLGTAGNGLIDLGNVKVSGVDTSKVIDLTATNDLAGITYTDLQSATVKASGFTTSAIYGNVQTPSATALNIASGATVTLTGSGKLVAHESGSGNWVNTDVTIDQGGELYATGTDAVIGNVSGSGAFGVNDGGSLTVAGNVNVGELIVEGTDSAMTIQTAASGAKAFTVQAAALDVEGTFTAADATLTLTNAATGTANGIDTIAKGGKVTVAALTKGDGDLRVQGALTVNGKLTSNGGTILVGNAKNAGVLVVDEFVSGSVFADPAWVDGKAEASSIVAVKTLQAAAHVEGGRNSVISLGTTDTEEATQLLAKSGFQIAETDASKKVYAIDTRTVNSVLYVNGGKTAETDAQMIKGNVAVNNKASASTTPVTGVTVGTNSMMALDATTVDTTGTTAVFAQAVTFEDNSVLYLANAAGNQTIKLSGTSLTNAGADVVYNGDILMDANFDQKAGTLTMSMIDAEDQAWLGDLPGLDAAMDMYATGANIGNTSPSALFNDWLYTSSNHTSINEVRAAAKDVASLGATTGVQTLTMDAVNQMADTVATRNSILTQRAQGVNVWADVNGGKFEAKKLFDGAGYSSDIYSGVLGLDYQFSCNAVLGAALTIGTADTDSKNSGVAASTDTDLVGFSVYASKTFADIWNVAADIGYMSASNDVTANGYDHAWKFSQDTDAFTVGVRGEVLTKAGAVNIVPHVGLRYTALSTDGFEAGYVTDIDDQNIFQMPVGVALSADFETNGWTLAPKFDLSVVPTFGDKDADLKLGISGVSATDDLSVRVIDSNPVQATLGINATNGDWGFGLSYKLGVGSDERMNNSFNAQVRYAF